MQNDLTQFIDEPYNNITYEGTSEVELKNGNQQIVG